MPRGGSLWARISIIALFGVGGAVIGGALMALTVSIVEPSGDKTRAFAELTAIVGAALGFLPAILTGAVYAFLRPGLLRIALAPVIAAAANAVWLVVSDQALAQLNIAVGAGAALICALLARALRLGEPKPTAPLSGAS